MFSPFDLSLTECCAHIVARAAKSRNKNPWRAPAGALATAWIADACRIASKTGFRRARKYWTRKGEFGLEYVPRRRVRAAGLPRSDNNNEPAQGVFAPRAVSGRVLRPGGTMHRNVMALFAAASAAFSNS